MTNSQKTIAIIGLGYVGLPLAVEFGKHRATLGFDINQTRIHELQNGQDHTLECSPEELQSAPHLRYSANASDLQAVQIYIVTVPTPVDQANRPDMTPLVISPLGMMYADGKYMSSVHGMFGSIPMETFPNMSLFDFIKWITIYRIEKIRPLWYVP